MYVITSQMETLQSYQAWHGFRAEMPVKVIRSFQNQRRKLVLGVSLTGPVNTLERLQRRKIIEKKNLWVSLLLMLWLKLAVLHLPAAEGKPSLEVGICSLVSPQRSSDELFQGMRCRLLCAVSFFSPYWSFLCTQILGLVVVPIVVTFIRPVCSLSEDCFLQLVQLPV